MIEQNIELSQELPELQDYFYTKNLEDFQKSDETDPVEFWLDNEKHRDFREKNHGGFLESESEKKLKLELSFCDDHMKKVIYGVMISKAKESISDKNRDFRKKNTQKFFKNDFKKRLEFELSFCEERTKKVIFDAMIRDLKRFRAAFDTRAIKSISDKKHIFDISNDIINNIRYLINGEKKEAGYEYIEVKEFGDTRFDTELLESKATKDDLDFLVKEGIPCLEVIEVAVSMTRKKYNFPEIKISSQDQSKLFISMLDPLFYYRKINKVIRQSRESFFYFFNKVSKQKSKYSSDDALFHFKKRKESERNFLKNHAFFCEETATLVPCAIAQKTAQQAFSQLYTFSKGIEARATEKGMVSAMLTITAPAEYHPNPQSGDTSAWREGGYKTPADAQKYLSDIWQKILARFNKKSLDFYAFRVAEPHADACPHWHMLIYFYAEDKQEIKKIIHSYHPKIETLDDLDDESVGANWKEIDPERRSASSYLAKYLYKTTGFTEDGEEEETETEPEAWRNIWRVRSHSFSGVPSGTATLWKFYRLAENEEFYDAHERKKRDYAVSGDFRAFLELLEMEEKADCLTKILYKDKEVKNDFGIEASYKKAVGIEAFYSIHKEIILKKYDFEIVDYSDDKALQALLIERLQAQVIDNKEIKIIGKVTHNYSRRAEEQNQEQENQEQEQKQPLFNDISSIIFDEP